MNRDELQGVCEGITEEICEAEARGDYAEVDRLLAEKRDRLAKFYAADVTFDGKKGATA